MALDFAQVDKDGSLTGPNVPISIELHGCFFYQMPVGKYSLLNRIRDYYADTTFTSEELPELKRKLESYVSMLTEVQQIALLKSMIELVRESLVRGLTIEVIAD
jgi:hypothetical protein